MSQLRSVFVRFVLFLVCCILSVSTFAQSYQDDLKEDDWELWGNNSVWTVKDGFLRTTIRAPDFFTIGLLQFKGIPGSYENFKFFADDRVIQRQVKKNGL